MQSSRCASRLFPCRLCNRGFGDLCMHVQRERLPLQVCSALHQRYADFAPALAASLPRALPEGGSVGHASLPRGRATLRLLAELLAAGVLTDLAPIMGAVRTLRIHISDEVQHIAYRLRAVTRGCCAAFTRSSATWH